MRNWKERHQDEWRRFDDATSSKAFCSQLFAFLFPKSNINWTCAVAVRMRLDDIYKAVRMVIDCVFVLCLRATLIFSFLPLIPDSKSFEQRSRTSSGVVGGLHGNLCRSHREEFHSFSRPSFLHPSLHPPHSRHPPFLSLQSCHLVRAPPICSATSPRCCNFLGPA